MQIFYAILFHVFGNSCPFAKHTKHKTIARKIIQKIFILIQPTQHLILWANWTKGWKCLKVTNKYQTNYDNNSFHVAIIHLMHYPMNVSLYAYLVFLSMIYEIKVRSWCNFQQIIRAINSKMVDFSRKFYGQLFFFFEKIHFPFH